MMVNNTESIRCDILQMFKHHSWALRWSRNSFSRCFKGNIYSELPHFARNTENFVNISVWAPALDSSNSSCLTWYHSLVLYECPANSKACTFTKVLLGEINPPSTFHHYVPTHPPFRNSWICPWCLLLLGDATILCTCAPLTSAYTQAEHHSSMCTGQTWTVLGELEGNWQSCCTAWFENPHPQRLLQCHQIPVSRSSNVTMFFFS